MELVCGMQAMKIEMDDRWVEDALPTNAQNLGRWKSVCGDLHT